MNFFKRLFGGSSSEPEPKPADEGPVSAAEVALVQDTWAKVVPIADTAADLFYTKLFELDPALRELFPEDMTEQKKKLMKMIGAAVGGLKDLGALVPVVQDLGKRHVGYGVTDAMYDTVGAALLDTLGKGLGDAFTDDVKAAWTTVYTVLATTMKDAAAAVTSDDGDEPGVTPAQIELVQGTWASVVPIADTAADLFYGKLFEIDPALRELFPEDMTEQKKKLMKMIGAAVGGLKDLESLVPVVQDLGKRHAGYKVKPSHYTTVAEALLWTLGQGLGDAFTDDVKEAWTVVYTILSKIMIEAAEGEAA